MSTPRRSKSPRQRSRSPRRDERWDRRKTTARGNQVEDERMREWVSQEDDFALKQAYARAEIRVKDGRARPIDQLAGVLVPDLETEDPVEVIAGLEGAALAEVTKEIDGFHKLEKTNRDYWSALKVLCQKPVTSSVTADIDKILSPKTLEQLQALQGQVEAKLKGDAAIDFDYWDQLLQRLKLWKARSRLSVYSSRRAPKARPKEAPRPKPVVDEPAVNTRFAFRQEDFAAAAKAVEVSTDEDEEVFAGEETVNTVEHVWAGKYRPRKPRYFNRVQMGYEWNKYNQTHYDHDNPPPKVVQGYKFNIFYPELADPAKAPSYKIEREDGRKRGQSFAPAGQEDTCLIRFIAGAPYEDIAFRIVDKEWDYSGKYDRGFKSTFEGGILQLHMQFKKVFYRK